MDPISERLFIGLKELNLIAPEKLSQVADESNKTGQPLADVLLQNDLISDENLGKTLADIHGLPYLSLATTPLTNFPVGAFPEEYVKRNRFAFLGVEDGVAKIAVVDPIDFRRIEHYVGQKIGLTLKKFFVTERSLEQAITIYKDSLQDQYNKIIKDRVTQLGKPNSDLPTEDIVDTLLEYGYLSNASDIHLEPEKDQSVVRYRVDGVLEKVLVFTPAVHEQVVSRIKFLANLRIDEHLAGQDGKLRMKLEKEDIDVRVSIVPVVHGEKVVLRLLSARFRQFGLADLGMSAGDLQKVTHAMSKPFGMILATGPTGSGKSTTMYGLLKILNTPQRNIATIEDPVEYEIVGINQIQVNPLADITFSNGLRSILRQDPNVIYVGEIRDTETADIAVNSAMTGHLVLSTLHTNDAATALPRLLDMGIEPFLVASTVNVIIAQRLVRKICERCKYSEVVSSTDLQKDPRFSGDTVQEFFGDTPTSSVRIYRGKGCPVCHNTGYQGRVGIFEILEMSDQIRQLLTQKNDAAVILQEAKKAGMRTMLDDGIEKVKQGVTTLDELLSVIQQ